MHNELKEKYILQVGIHDAKRLEIMNKILNPQSQQLLSNYLKPDMTVVEIGCGTGIMTTWLASKVKNVIAIDISSEQIDLAKTYIKSMQLSNVEFRCADFRDVSLPITPDVVYSRYVMIHLRDPASLLHYAVNVVKKSGLVILEEPIISDMMTHPYTDLWELPISIYEEASKRNQVDIDVGKRLYEISDGIDNIRTVRINASQPYVSKELSIEYIVSAMQAITHMVEDQGRYDEYAVYMDKILSNQFEDFSYSKYMNVIQHVLEKMP